MHRNVVKVLDKKFADITAGQKMLVSSPQQIMAYIYAIYKGASRTVKRMRLELAQSAGADNTCPVSTGIFLRMAVVQVDADFPYWRVIDGTHPLVKKLSLDADKICHLGNDGGIA